MAIKRDKPVQTASLDQPPFVIQAAVAITAPHAVGKDRPWVGVESRKLAGPARGYNAGGLSPRIPAPRFITTHPEHSFLDRRLSGSENYEKCQETNEIAGFVPDGKDNWILIHFTSFG